MRISTEHVARLLETRLEHVRRAGGPRAPVSDASRADVVSVSARAQEVRAALQAARQAELANPAQMEALSQVLREGGYRLPAATIGEAILRDLGL